MSTLAEEYLKELEMEAGATRKCLEKIPGELSDWKPHEKSMQMGYLAIIVAEIPKWITYMVQKGEIDFATFERFTFKTTDELVARFDANMKEVTEVLKGVSNEKLLEKFSLKSGGQLLAEDLIGESIQGTINHGVHHRGQLTVYMRLNNIPVPSIYGPSADDKTF